jgi:hypothetical protein
MAAAVSRCVRRASAALIAACSLGWASLARAQPAPLELEWRAPAHCPSGTQILKGVSAVLGSASAAWRQVAARVDVQSTGDRVVRVQIASVVNGVAGERTFEAESCSAASDAAILILALLVNPDAPRDAETGAAVAPPTGASAAETRPRTRARRSEARPRRSSSFAVARAPAFGVGLWPALDRGSMPGWSEGLLASLAYTRGPLRIEASGGAWLRQTGYAPSSNAGAEFRRVTLGLSGAYLWRAGALALGPFVGVAVDSLSADGFGGTQSFNRHASVVSPLAGARLEWSMTRWLAGGIAVLGKVPTKRPAFLIERRPSQQSSRIFEVAPLSFEARAGWELRFP